MPSSQRRKGKAKQVLSEPLRNEYFKDLPDRNEQPREPSNDNVGYEGFR